MSFIGKIFAIMGGVGADFRYMRSGKEKRSNSIFENLEAFCSNSHNSQHSLRILMRITPSESTHGGGGGDLR